MQVISIIISKIAIIMAIAIIIIIIIILTDYIGMYLRFKMGEYIVDKQLQLRQRRHIS